jgi:glyoxylase-like metal-dependent hydrolase (beta-lactamase superfamily II)
VTLAPLRFRLLKVGQCTHPECMAMRGGRWANAVFPALCALIEHPVRGLILFDTGYSTHFTDATAPFPERLYRWSTPVTLAPQDTLLCQLAAMGIQAADISHVIVSHFHGDHIAGLKDFPNARVIAMRADYDAIRSKSRVGGLLRAYLPALMPDDIDSRMIFAEDLPTMQMPAELAPFERAVDLLQDGSIAGIHLPGHTRGQMGIVLRQTSHQLVFMVADACWSMPALKKNARPTWMAERLFDNAAKYRRTFDELRRVAAHPAAPDIVPSHCEQTWRRLYDASA